MTGIHVSSQHCTVLSEWRNRIRVQAVLSVIRYFLEVSYCSLITPIHSGFFPHQVTGCKDRGCHTCAVCEAL